MENSTEFYKTLSACSARLTAKRINGADSEAIDRWYPYYAGYSYAFASEILSLLNIKGGLVLDPWNGSGTTTSAAFHLGNRAVGFDLNPATILIAQAKLVTKNELKSLPCRLDDALLNVDFSKNAQPRKSDPLQQWVRGRTQLFTRSFLAALYQHENIDEITNLSPASCLLALCLLSALRKNYVTAIKSNKAWLTPDEGSSRVRIDRLKSDMRTVCNDLIADVDFAPSRRAKKTKSMLGDSRNLPIKNASVDVILSSPPYCTRIDYAKSTAFELAAIGVTETDLRRLRDNLMGTTTIRKKAEPALDLPDSVMKLLSQIENHPSRASSVYYIKNTKQYFADAFRSVGEISRVLKNGGRAALVLQNSYYKEIPINLSELYCDLGNAHGLTSRIIAKKRVNRTMVAVNTRALAHRKDREYSEDVVLLEKLCV